MNIINGLTYLLIALIVFLCALPLTAQAKQGYASDQVEVLMRTGPSHKHTIVKVLKSGATLEILKQDRSSGYTRVKAAGGATGWVLSRHLMAEPAARVLLKELSDQFAEEAGEQEQPENPQAQAEVIRHQYEVLSQQVIALEKNNVALEMELSELKQLSADAMQLNSQNQEMRQQVDVLTTKLDELGQENQELSKQVERKWFFAGAIVLAAGFFLGIIIPRIRWRRQSRYNDFV